MLSIIRAAFGVGGTTFPYNVTRPSNPTLAISGQNFLPILLYTMFYCVLKVIITINQFTKVLRVD